MTPSTYLDYNASAPARPDVIAAVATAMQAPANASSIHAFGRGARKIIETAREQVGALVGAAANQVIFNSGATEGNNTVLRTFAGSRILISAGEHASIDQTGRALGAEMIPLTRDGIIDLTAFEALLKTEVPPALVSVMWVNNETGVINPVADVARLARAAGAVVHVDAVQAVGKTPVDMRAVGADFITISAHKIGGPQGVGALIMSDGQVACIAPPVLLTGGGQERSLRAGTENIAGIAGFGVAAAAARNDLGTLPAQLKHWQQQLEKMLATSTPRVTIHGQNAPRVANTICFSVTGMDAQTMLMNLDLAGIALSSGSACSSGKVKESHVLKAMGVPSDQSRGALRLSMGYGTTQDDIARFTEIWQKMAQKF